MSTMGLRGRLGMAGLGVIMLVVVGTMSWRSTSDDADYPRKDYSQDVSKIYQNLGCWQVQRKCYKRAIKTFLYALQESPDSLELYDWLGRAYEGDGDKSRALTTYFRALARNQHFSDVRFWSCEDELPSGGQESLLFGSYEEWRGQVVPYASLLVYTPESDADTIMLLRFIPDLARRVGNVVLVAKPSLTRLCKDLERHVSNLEVIDTSSCLATLPPCQCHVALSQVPAYLNYAYENIPGRDAYLKPDQYMVEKFHDMIGTKNHDYVVGIALETSKGGYRDKNLFYTVLLDQIAQVSDAIFYLLPTLDGDKNADSKVEAMVANFKINELKKIGRCIDTRKRCNDWAEVAALIENCDAVIGLDNAVVHLAGAIGKKTIVLLSEVSDWRWLSYSEGESSVWYKSFLKLSKKDSTSWQDLTKRALQIAVKTKTLHQE